MSELVTALAGDLLDEQGRLVESVTCVACGYDLRGAMADGSCPECGADVASSLRPLWGGYGLDTLGRLTESLDCASCGAELKGLRPSEGCGVCGASVGATMRSSLLRAADPGWRSGVVRGLVLLYAGFGLTMVAGVLGAVGGIMGALRGGMGGGAWGWMLLASGMGLLAAGVWAWGVFGFTAAEPSGRRAGDAWSVWVARWVEVSRLASYLVSAGVTVAMFWSGASMMAPTMGPLALVGQGVAGVAMALGAVSMAALVVYLGRLLVRVLRVKLARQARAVAAILVVSGVVLGVGQFLMVASAQSMTSASGSMAQAASSAGGSAASSAGGGPTSGATHTWKQPAAGGGETTTVMTTYGDGSSLMEVTTRDASGAVVSQRTQVNAGFNFASAGGMMGLFFVIQCGTTLAMAGVGVGYVWALVLSILWWVELRRQTQEDGAVALAV
ncbi:MAG: hypothetical protein AAF823_02190 [Planctomycetota bacterium]